MHPTYYKVTLCTTIKGKLQESDYATTLTRPFRCHIVYAKLNPPHQYHPQEINEYPKGSQAKGFGFSWGVK